MPPALLIRSTAIWVPTSAVMPPAAAAPVSGYIVPILYGFACPNASRQGAGTSSVAPTAPAAVADRPRNVRRVVLPLHHISFAHGASCQRSAMVFLLDVPQRGTGNRQKSVRLSTPNGREGASGSRRTAGCPRPAGGGSGQA